MGGGDLEERIERRVFLPQVCAEEALEALRVPLDEAEIATLDAAFPIGCAAGLRYPGSMMSSLGREAPALGS